MAYVDSVATNTAEYTDEKVRASVSSLGTTFEGRPIKILRLALKVSRPTILTTILTERQILSLCSNMI